MVRVTMRDVAEVMGVSKMTVSNAFNRPDQLSEELRTRILERARKMGYGGPSAPARQLKSGRTNAYGVLIPEGVAHAFTDPYLTAWMSGLAVALEAAGAHIVLVSAPDDDLEPIRRVAVDGFVGLCATDPMMQVAAERELPMVTTDPSGPQGSWVTIDDYQAALDVTSHVRSLGHERIAVMVEPTHPGHLTGVEQSLEDYQVPLKSAQDSGFYATWARVQGVFDGLEGASVSVIAAPRSTRADGQATASVLLDAPQPPTAVVCLTDAMALGVLDAIRARGLQPGRDVSVTGFDDIPDSAPAGLTTISQPSGEKGRLVGELLLDQNRTDRQITLDHHLVVRTSTGPAPTN